MKYKIISDSSCDLKKEYLEQNSVDVVPFYVSFDETTYYKEGLEIDHNEFYQRMIDQHVYPKSSLPSITDFAQVFTNYAKEGMPILCICISSKLSGSYQSALNAKSIVLEEYPEANIEIINSTFVTVLQGLLVKEIVKMNQDGLSLTETVEEINKLIPSGRIMFTLDNIDYLKHGGRIGKLLSLASSTLGIRPLILFKEGEIFPAGISRSRKKSKAKIISLAQEFFADKENVVVNDYSFTVGTGIDFDEANEFKEELSTVLSIDEIDIGTIGVTVGTHTGPHPIGVAFLKKYSK